MALPLDTELKFGFITAMHNPAMTRATVDLAEKFDYDSLWVGDHIEFPVPILDPLLQIAQAAGMSSKLTFGTGVYLLPMRHIVHVAKQVTSLDQLTEGGLFSAPGSEGNLPMNGPQQAYRWVNVAPACPKAFLFSRSF